MPVYMTPPPRSPLAQLLTAVVAAVVMAAGFMLGIVALVVFAGVALVAWLGFWLRAKWLGRSNVQGPEPGAQGRPRGPARPHSRQRSGGQTIEAEYEVVSRRQDPPS